MKPTGYNLSKPQAQAYGKRGGLARGKLLQATYLIDGIVYTNKTIAAKLGVSADAIGNRCRVLKRAGKSITWESLRRASDVPAKGHCSTPKVAPTALLAVDTI